MSHFDEFATPPTFVTHVSASVDADTMTVTLTIHLNRPLGLGETVPIKLEYAVEAVATYVAPETYLIDAPSAITADYAGVTNITFAFQPPSNSLKFGVKATAQAFPYKTAIGNFWLDQARVDRSNISSHVGIVSVQAVPLEGPSSMASHYYSGKPFSVNITLESPDHDPQTISLFAIGKLVALEQPKTVDIFTAGSGTGLIVRPMTVILPPNGFGAYRVVLRAWTYKTTPSGAVLSEVSSDILVHY